MFVLSDCHNYNWACSKAGCDYQLHLYSAIQVHRCQASRMHSLACLTFGWLNFALPASVRWRLAPCTWALREGLGFAWLIGDVWKRLHHPGKCGTAGNLRGKGQAGPSVEQCQISTLKTLTYSCRRLHSLGRQLVFASLKAFPRNKSC